MHGVRGHLVFECGAGLYGIPGDTAAEVVNLPALTRVPGTPSHVLGVFAHRGEVMPVIDLLQLVKPGEAHPAWKRAVVLRSPSGAIALTATKVLGVSMLDGRAAPLGTTGIHRHLFGPLQAPAGEVSAVDAEGLLAFLAKG